MLEIIPFEPKHFSEISLQDEQAYLAGWVTPAQAEELTNYTSLTAMSSGKVKAIAGIFPVWAGRSLAWSYLSDMGPKVFLKVHHAIKRQLDIEDSKRIEMTVDCDMVTGHRWARLLGFKMEAECMTAYGPGGRDCSLYARIKT